TRASPPAASTYIADRPPCAPSTSCSSQAAAVFRSSTAPRSTTGACARSSTTSAAGAAASSPRRPASPSTNGARAGCSPPPASTTTPIHPSTPIDRRTRRSAGRASHQLLAAVDVVGGARERRVRHQVHRQLGHVGGPDDAPDREGLPQLLPARLDVLAQQPGGQRRVDEAGGDQVDPDRRDLERQVLDQRG